MALIDYENHTIYYSREILEEIKTCIATGILFFMPDEQYRALCNPYPAGTESD